MENLRPQQIYDALILREIDPQNEIAVMENSFEIVTDAKHHQVQQADYEIDVIRERASAAGIFPARSFSAAPTCCRIAS